MQAGLIFQVVSLLFFIALSMILLWRCWMRTDLLGGHFSMLRSPRAFDYFSSVSLNEDLICRLLTLKPPSAQAFATIFILIRSYRVVELSQGFKGHIWYNEIESMVLEGGMVSLAVILLTIGHPGFGFQGRYHDADFKVFVRKQRGRSKIRSDEGTGLTPQSGVIVFFVQPSYNQRPCRLVDWTRLEGCVSWRPDAFLLPILVHHSLQPLSSCAHLCAGPWIGRHTCSVYHTRFSRADEVVRRAPSCVGASMEMSIDAP